jgi:nitrogenase iron protein NifH
VPTPLNPQQLRDWSSGWADHLVAAERAQAERDREVA